MGAVRTIRAVTAAVVTLLVAYLAIIAYTAYARGYSRHTMDWNSDGTTSVGEFLESVDIDKRAAGNCIDYFALKDGLTVKLECPRQ